VLSVQPRSDDSGDEKLGSIGVGTGVGHRQKSRLAVFELEILIYKISAKSPDEGMCLKHLPANLVP
jgi:hypothetical protein